MLKPLWKPVVHRAVTGRWERFVMKAGPVPYPGPMKQPGLYLHVPFCKELCPYCPYNREKFEPAAFDQYHAAVLREIDMTAANMPAQSFTSLYIGGGTPTVDPAGLAVLIRRLKDSFRIQGDICIELHPSEMDDDCLRLLKDAGVTMLSVGVETTDDGLLSAIGRRHDGATARDAVRRAVAAGFRSVNVDLMFSLPGQSLDQLDADLAFVLGEGVDQISTYPIFGFPYSELGERLGLRTIQRPSSRLIRRMFDRIGERSVAAGLERCAVWSYLKPSKRKFSSVTRHHYVGFGPSAGSMTGDSFSVNTFSVKSYIEAVGRGRRPTALAMPLTRRLEMAYWLYWRAYEMHIPGKEFRLLFDADLDSVFGHLLKTPRLLGMASKTPEGFEITESGAYWIHRLQNEYSLNYINKLWGTCRKTAWPEAVEL